MGLDGDDVVAEREAMDSAVIVGVGMCDAGDDLPRSQPVNRAQPRTHRGPIA